MSSRRRRSRGNQADAFDSNESPEATDLEGFADILYGGGKVSEDLRRLDSRPTRVKPIALERILPDPAQARRVMPLALRARWLREPAAIPEILEEWMIEANAEAMGRGRPPVSVPEALRRDPADTEALPEESELPEPGPIESSFEAVVRLAASIYHHGLANPITVVAADKSNFQVETGERRLLAYHLLQSLPDFVEGDWGQIPARVVEEKDIWRQAAENLAREDLNAISLARQLALLLMDIYAEKVSFARFEDMPGVDWYAQVHDSKQFPVPYGRGAELAAAMGLKSAAQIRQYRQLLSLPQEVWNLADEHDWTEYRIREMMKRARQLAGRSHQGAESTADESAAGGSVTTVTDHLTLLARHQAGLVPFLPPEYEATGTKRKSGGGTADAAASGARDAIQLTIARNVRARVTLLDAAGGRATLEVTDPALLKAIEAGEEVIITVQRRHPS